MTGDQTFYSFAATLIPGLLFGGVLAERFRPRSLEEVSAAETAKLKEKITEDAEARVKAVVRANPSFVGIDPSQIDAVEQRVTRSAIEEALAPLMEPTIAPAGRQVAGRRLQTQALGVILAIVAAIVAESYAIYGAIVSNPGVFTRDIVIVAVVFGMTAVALALALPWLTHIKRPLLMGTVGMCFVASATGVGLLIRAFSTAHSEAETAVIREDIERAAVVQRRLNTIQRHGIAQLMEYVTLQTEEDNSRGATRHRDEDRIVKAKLELEEDASEAKREEKAYELAILGQP